MGSDPTLPQSNIPGSDNQVFILARGQLSDGKRSSIATYFASDAIRPANTERLTATVSRISAISSIAAVIPVRRALCALIIRWVMERSVDTRSCAIVNTVIIVSNMYY